jgi:hypothetical protein
MVPVDQGLILTLFAYFNFRAIFLLLSVGMSICPSARLSLSLPAFFDNLEIPCTALMNRSEIS